MKYINPFKVIAELRAEMKVMTFCLDSRREEIKRLKNELATAKQLATNNAEGLIATAKELAKARMLLTSADDLIGLQNMPFEDRVEWCKRYAAFKEKDK